MLILWSLLAALLLFFGQRMLYKHRWFQMLKVSICFDSPTITEGETVTLTERFENRKLLPLPYFSYRYIVNRNYAVVREARGGDAEVQRRIALPARRSVRCRTRLNGLTRGVYGLTDVTVSAADLLYTVHPYEQVRSPARLIVYPRKLPVQKLSLPCQQLLGDVLTRRYAQEDPFQLRGIRQYEIYDSMRNVNWKASARTGELKVNQHEYTTNEALLILLDLGAGTEPQREKLISLASSLSRFFLHRGVMVALLSNMRSCVTGAAVRVLPGGSLRQQTVIDTALAQIKLAMDPVSDFPSFLRTVPVSTLRRSTTVVLSADPTDGPMTAYRTLLGDQHGYLISTANEQLAEAPGVTIYVWDEEKGEVRV